MSNQGLMKNHFNPILVSKTRIFLWIVLLGIEIGVIVFMADICVKIFGQEPIIHYG